MDHFIVIIFTLLHPFLFIWFTVGVVWNDGQSFDQCEQAWQVTCCLKIKARNVFIGFYRNMLVQS